MAWPVELGYDGEALCARCLHPLRGPDGLRLGGPGSVTTVEYFLRAVGDHIDGCPDPTIDVEYHEHVRWCRCCEQDLYTSTSRVGVCECGHDVKAHKGRA